MLYLPIWLYDVSYNGIPKGNLQVQAPFEEQVPTETGQAHCKDIPVAVPRSESGEWTPLMDSAGPSLIKNWGVLGVQQVSLNLEQNKLVDAGLSWNAVRRLSSAQAILLG